MLMMMMMMMMIMLLMDDVVVLVRASPATVQICSLHGLYLVLSHLCPAAGYLA